MEPRLSDKVAGSSDVIKVVFVSVREADPEMTGRLFRRVCEGLGIGLSYHGVSGDEVDDDVLAFHNLADATSDADMVYVRSLIGMERFKSWDRYRKVLESTDAKVYVYSGSQDTNDVTRYLFDGSDDEYTEFVSYAGHVCPENDGMCFRWMLRRAGVSVGSLEAPVVPPYHGVYHPDRLGIDKDGLVAALDPDKVTVGVFFTARSLAYGNMEAIDAVIRAVENHGMNAYPVFFSEFMGKGSMDTAEAIHEYFTKDGRPLVDCLVSFTRVHIYHGGRVDPERYGRYSRDLNVPIINAMTLPGDYLDFEKDRVGMSKGSIRANVVYQELDGFVISVPVAATVRTPGGKKVVPIPERIDHLIGLAGSWGRLGRKTPSERRIAIIMWQYRPELSNIGYAGSLDTLESIADIMKVLDTKGYALDRVPADGSELVSWILDGVTNDLEPLSEDAVEERAADLVGSDDYRKTFASIPQWDREQIGRQWGEPPGEICVNRGKLVIPGFTDGNVFIGYQPCRGWASRRKEDLHDPTMFTQHQYLAYYRWLKDVFKADIVYHMGTHGSLEWLPGKNVGLSDKCNPDFVLDAMPNVYPYVIDDPGEGIQAKRRAESVLVGYMPNSMARAGSYEELDEVNVQIQDLLKYGLQMDAQHRKSAIENIYMAAERNSLLKDIGAEGVGPEAFEPYVVPLHEYIEDVKDTLIRADMHILGRIPAGSHMDETIYSVMRLDNGDIRSLRDAFAENVGCDMAQLKGSPSSMGDGGELNSETLERVDGSVMGLLSRMREDGYDYDRAIRYLASEYGRVSPDLEKTVRYICEVLVPNILSSRGEIDHLIDGTSGKYIEPGPSGTPTRGGANILPTGRNFYGIDPDSVPTRTAWDVGRRMADQMISRHIDENGTYPRQVGVVLWATDTMKTGGDDVAYVLWLMGVRPVWSAAGGQVTGLEVIPLGELGRPRSDVTISITGLFRDVYPSLIDLLDDAVRMVSELDESDRDNAFLENLRRDVAEDISSGISVDEARRRNSVRIFGAPPGSYGTGAGMPIENGTWNTVNDLADSYKDWVCNGYSRGNYGERLVNQFARRFGRLQVTVKNTADREIDILDCDDFYQYLGGMNAYVRAYGEHKDDYRSYMADDSDPSLQKTRSAKEELRFVFRSKVLNPKFVKGLMEHGYRGAGEIERITGYTLAWGATSDITEDWMYEGIVDRYLADSNVLEWMEQVNPYAVMGMIDILEDAIEHGLWNASEEYRQRLRDVYLEAEERMEDLLDR
ncbi:MAG: cobaltochelatase subunit CobN [Candidatus Methanomethylophilaceae archaeon]|nr:cobaltochelatase subunit CobN [Candidatus Methanomethylophilaceae archaeon]